MATQTNATNFDPSTASIFVAPDAPQAFIVKGTYEGDFVFLSNVPITKVIELPDAWLLDEDVVDSLRTAMDDLQSIKGRVDEDLREDLLYLIDSVGADLHWCEAMLDEVEDEEDRTAEFLAQAEARPRDERGRFIARPS